MPANKKILIATGIFPPDIGGPATYVETLLLELPQRGFDVRVITYADKKLEIGNYNLEIFKVSRNQNILLRYLKYFIQVWKSLAWADIVYAQDPICSGVPVALACKISNKPYLMKIVGDYAWEQGRQKYGVNDLLDAFQDKKYGWQVALLRFFQFWTARGAEKIITPSYFLKSIILKWQVKPEKIKVIYNSVRKAQSAKTKDELRRELKLEGDIIISVGRLVAWKGFDVLLEVLPALLKENPNFKLLIAGSGPEREACEARIKKYGLESAVTLLGALEQQKLWEYMKASDYFVLNTGYEGLPHLVIEAFYLGLPVITTAIGGNLEVIRKNENGLLIEYNNREQLKNAILEIWRDEEARTEMIENGFLDLDKYNTENMIKGLLAEL